MTKIKKTPIRDSKQSMDAILLERSPKLTLMKVRHGVEYIGMYTELRLTISENKKGGYWIDYNEEFIELFTHDLKISKPQFIEFLNYCFSENLLNNEMYENYKILTSEELQINWLKCASARPRFEEGINIDYFVIDPESYVVKNRQRFKNKL